MSANYEAKLADMGITLPMAPAPAAKYVPFVVIEDMYLVKFPKTQVA
jgi:hypothetical protein